MSYDLLRDAIRAEWEEELGVRPADDDHFFDLGGDSLAAVRVTGRLRPVLGVQLKLATLLMHPEFEEYVTHIHRIRAELPVNNPAVRISRDGELPLPFVLEQLIQNELKSLRESTPTTALPFTYVALSISSALSNEAIVAAVDEVVARHEMLRIKVEVEVDANRARVRLDTAMDWRLPVRRCPDIGATDRTEFLVQELTAMLEKRIDLEHAPLLHAGLYEFTPEHRVLMLAIDHLIVDGRSVGVIIDDLALALNGDLERAGDGRLDFFDWAAWQRAQLGGPRGEELLKFWSAELEGIGPHPDLSLPRPIRETTAVWHSTRITLVNEDVAALLGNRESGTGVLETLLAAVALTWRRVQGKYETVVWVPTGDRVDPAFEGVVGPFAHALPVRIPVPDVDARSALRTAGQALLRTLTHQEFPTPELLRALAPESRLGRRPPRLFLGVGLGARREFDVPGGLMERLSLPRPVQAPAQPGISFYAHLGDGRLELILAGDPREVDPGFIDDLGEQLTKSLVELCSLARN
jgi:hypothetical protein